MNKRSVVDNREYLSSFKNKNIVLSGKLVSIPVNTLNEVILTFKNIYHGDQYVCDHLNIKIKKYLFDIIDLVLLKKYEFKGKVFSYKTLKCIDNINIYVRNYSLKKIIYLKLKKNR